MVDAADFLTLVGEGDDVPLVGGRQRLSYRP
jgi:hypothetical protein